MSFALRMDTNYQLVCPQQSFLQIQKGNTNLKYGEMDNSVILWVLMAKPETVLQEAGLYMGSEKGGGLRSEGGRTPHMLEAENRRMRGNYPRIGGPTVFSNMPVPQGPTVQAKLV